MQESQKNTKAHELEPVPMNERKSFLSITMVWTGFIFVVTSMMAGGGLSSGLSLKEIIIVTLLGNIFLSIIAILVSIIASRTGLSFALLCRYSFGEKGSRLASLFIPAVNIGWYTIQAAVYGHLIANIFNLSPVYENIAMIFSAIIMGVFAIIGIGALTVLGFVAIPAIIFLSIATTVKAVGIAGGMDIIFSVVPAEVNKISIATGLTIVIGTWIFSASTCIADFMRFAKNVKEAIISTTLGLVIGNTLLILSGAITAMALKNSDLSNVLLGMGLIVPSLILMTTNIFTTNGGNLYSTGLNLSNALKIEHKKILIIVLILSALLTLLKPYKIDALFGFLSFLGTIVPPLPGIIIADYYILNKSSYKKTDTFKNWNINAWIAWGFSIIVVISVNIGFAPLNGIILGALSYIFLMKLNNHFTQTQKVNTSEIISETISKKEKILGEIVNSNKIKTCKVLAILGIILMGTGSFIACLAETSQMSSIGSGILIVSLIITSYGFTYWRP